MEGLALGRAEAGQVDALAPQQGPVLLGEIVADHAHIAPGAHLGGDVRIGEGAFVGIGATVMPQRSIGAWSIVGAGALVHRDIPDRATAIGVPARFSAQPQPDIDTP